MFLKSKTIDEIMGTFQKAVKELERHSSKHDVIAEGIETKISDLMNDREKHLGESLEATRLAEKMKQAFL